MLNPIEHTKTIIKKTMNCFLLFLAKNPPPYKFISNILFDDKYLINF